MSQTIQIKRRNSGAAGAPASLAAGEMAWSAVDRILYFGSGDNGAGAPGWACLARRVLRQIWSREVRVIYE